MSLQNFTAFSDQPLLPDSYATLTIAWFSVAFGIISCVIITRKAILDPSILRIGCIVMVVMTIGWAVANALRIPSQINFSIYFCMRAILLILYVDLLVLITLNLGSKFYIQGDHINKLYWTTIVATVLFTVTCFITLVLGVLWLDTAYTITNNVGQVSWPIVVFFAYCYAFAPVIKMRTGVDDTLSGAVAVGVWYLTGMAVLLILQLIVICISISYSPLKYKEFSIIEAAISEFLRMVMLDFYSFPPPNKFLVYFRRKLSPDSSNMVSMTSQRPSSIAPSDRFERLSLGFRLSEDSRSVNTTTSRSQITPNNTSKLTFVMNRMA